MMNVTGVFPATDPTRAMNVGAASPTTTIGDNFDSIFAKIATSARDSMRAGEAAAISGVAGDNSVQNVVRAMMSAEEQLRAAIAVRDRVVAAYQEVSRMQI